MTGYTFFELPRPRQNTRHNSRLEVFRHYLCIVRGETRRGLTYHACLCRKTKSWSSHARRFDVIVAGFDTLRLLYFFSMLHFLSMLCFFCMRYMFCVLHSFACYTSFACCASSVCCTSLSRVVLDLHAMRNVSLCVVRCLEFSRNRIMAGVVDDGRNMLPWCECLMAADVTITWVLDAADFTIA